MLTAIGSTVKTPTRTTRPSSQSAIGSGTDNPEGLAVLRLVGPPPEIPPLRGLCRGDIQDDNPGQGWHKGGRQRSEPQQPAQGCRGDRQGRHDHEERAAQERPARSARIERPAGADHPGST